jgi:GNAT superfamily N-acetyltransferase
MRHDINYTMTMGAEYGQEEEQLLIMVVAFLTSLSANLRIDPDLPSPLGTPTTFRHGGYAPQPLPPTPLSFSTLPAPHNPYLSPVETKVMSSVEATAPVKAATEELPQLSTYTAESEDDRIEGLRLVADSVAQQRQVSSKMLIFHPITLASFTLISAIAIQWMLRAYNDWFMVATTVGGITMSFLIFIRWMTGDYIGLAEDIDMDWLGDDKLIVVKWGEDIIGSLVLGWADNDAAKKRGRRRRGKAVIRAWTVKLKYRGKGVGEGLLEEAVKVAGERGANGIIFDADHASKSSHFGPFQLYKLIIYSQTPPAFFPQFSTATSTSKKSKPKKHLRKSPTTKATLDSGRAPPHGAADR